MEMDIQMLPEAQGRQHLSSVNIGTLLPQDDLKSLHYYRPDTKYGTR